MGANKLTVLMPVYNEASYLRSSIKSILDQSYREFEFLILNDDSTDNSEEIILSFKDPRINYFKTDKIKISELLNIGIKKSSGDLIARMDADDIAMPTRLERQLRFIKNRGPNFISSAWFITFRNKNILNIIKHPVSDGEIKRTLNISNPICHPLAIFHKDFIQSLNGYDEDLECMEDHMLWLKARKQAEFGNIPEVLLLKREKQNSLGSVEKAQPRKFIYNLLQNKFDINLYNNIGESEKDKFRLEYLYGTRHDLRKRIYNSGLFSLNDFYEYMISFLPEKFFSKKPGHWLKWKLNQLMFHFSPIRKDLSHQLKKIA